MTASELSLFIEGCELVGRRALSPDAVVIASLGARQKSIATRA